MNVDQLRQIMPLIGAKADTFIGPLNDAMDEFEINTPARQAAFIAQLAHESGQFRYMQELADGGAYDNRADLGNTRPEAVEVARRNGTTAGRWFKGHGPIQITGYSNHKVCGEALGEDLIEHPRALIEPGLGCRSAAWFWASHGLNEIADRGDFLTITRRINGGTNGLADRQQFWERAKSVLAMPDFNDVRGGVV